MISKAHLELQKVQSPDELTFKLTGVPVAFANAVRRTMIADVETMSIEIVQFLENTVCAVPTVFLGS